MTPTIISREDAAAKGLKRYYTGEPCNARGHLSERYVCNQGCVQCMTFKTPNKRKGPKGNNVGWPAMGLVFTVQPGPLQEEMEAAFRYIEAMRWHDYAVQELRKNPELMLKHMVPPTVQEQAKATLELERMRRISKLARERAGGE